MTIKYADMFCGIGGFRLALEKFDTKCVFSSDYEIASQTIYQSLFNEMPYDKDIRTYDYNTLPDIDLLCGGFPCAKFSIAGDREGFASKDPRGQMFFELAKILKIKKPKMFWFENVKGLLNHDNGESFKRILWELDKLGYDVEWQCVNAKNFGYPVLRERVFIVGHIRGQRTGKIFPILESISKNDSEICIYQYRRGNFRRFQGYCPTLTASMGTGGNNVPLIIDNNRLRKLTPRECFRLQGIEDESIDKILSCGLSDSKLYERAGRTVFQPAMREIAKRICKSI